MLCGGLRKDGRRVGVSLPDEARLGVELIEPLMSFSTDFVSVVGSLFVSGVEGRFTVFSGDLGGDMDKDPDSIKLLKSLTLPVCKDCIRLWVAPLMSDRSGDSWRF
jgi:hypothetical protein